MTEEDLIRGCLKHEQTSQREVYNLHFSKMMRLCMRYAKDTKEAKSILLDGFKNVFNEFRNFLEYSQKTNKNPSDSTLEEWIKKEIITSAIRHMHNNKKEYFVSSTVSMRDLEKSFNEEISDEQIMKCLNKQMILNALHELTPSYRAIYNLHEMDGYSHLEISKLLDISEYTSADGLSKAKFNLRKAITKMIPK